MLPWYKSAKDCFWLATFASIISFVLGRKLNYETHKNGTDTKVASLYGREEPLIGKIFFSWPKQDAKDFTLQQHKNEAALQGCYNSPVFPLRLFLVRSKSDVSKQTE